MRKLHLYLNCLFTPMLVFFVVTGAWQTFRLHSDSKMGYKAPRILKQLSSIHENQTLPLGKGSPRTSLSLQYFILSMAAGFLFTTLLGIVMAFRFAGKRWLVWSCLATGFLLPAVLLCLGGGIQ